MISTFFFLFRLQEVYVLKKFLQLFKQKFEAKPLINEILASIHNELKQVTLKYQQ